MILRPMQGADLPTLAALERQCFSAPWTETALGEELLNPVAVFWVAEEAGALLGYAGMHVVCGEGFIHNVAVFPAARRKGVARALVTALYEKTQGYLTLEVRQSNGPAIALYRSLQFTEVGRRKAFYQNPKEDALLFTRKETPC